jgi:hypothetical protein
VARPDDRKGVVERLRTLLFHYFRRPESLPLAATTSRPTSAESASISNRAGRIPAYHRALFTMNVEAFVALAELGFARDRIVNTHE